MPLQVLMRKAEGRVGYLGVRQGLQGSLQCFKRMAGRTQQQHRCRLP